MNNLTTYLKSNQHLLNQILSTLKSLDTDQLSIYSSQIPIIGGASIGTHLRHILDFYTAFFLGAENGYIDYDDRQRDSGVENELGSGISQILITTKRLETMLMIANKDVEINAAVEVGCSESSGKSNLARELQSLHSHTTHHMAIIAIVLKLNQIEVDCDFGKAPSTIHYEHSLKSTEKMASSRGGWQNNSAF